MAANAGMQQQQPGPAAQVAAEVGAERREPDRDGHVSHDLAEQLLGVALDRSAGRYRLVVCRGPRLHHSTQGNGKRATASTPSHRSADQNLLKRRMRLSVQSMVSVRAGSGWQVSRAAATPREQPGLDDEIRPAGGRVEHERGQLRIVAAAAIR